MADDADLDRLRAEIDDLDDAIHDRLIRRAEVVRTLASAKNNLPGGSGMRPRREAALVGRQLRRHTGPLPHAVIFRIWREIVAASLRLQGPLSVAICAPENSVGYWDLARNHFGSATPMILHRSAGVVLRSVSAQAGAFGILPVPPADDEMPWWPLLADMPEDGPRIVMRLPHFEDRTIRSERLSALVVGPAPFAESGTDVSLLVVTAQAQISRPRLIEALKSVGIAGRCTATFEAADGESGYLHLVEVDGFVAAGDKRLSALVGTMTPAVTRVSTMGGYPVPIDAGNLNVGR